MTTLQDLKAIAGVLGATVEDTKTGETHECRVEAPKGHHWIDGGVHELLDVANRPWKPDYADLLSRMACGTEKCGPQCEYWDCSPA